MKKLKELKIVDVGTPCIQGSSEEEEKTFYITLLARILELRKQKLIKEE